MNLLPPAGTGIWMRCQLHAHTTNSDGEASPAAVCAHYAVAGYDVLAITDHWHVTDEKGGRLLVLPSSELTAHCDAANPEREAEVLALGVGHLPDAHEAFPSIEDLASWIRSNGGAPYLCHPYWSGLTSAHLLEAPSLAGLEVFNGASEVQQGNGLSAVHWDGALVAGRLPFAIATDDAHAPGEDSDIAWTMVHCAERGPEAVVDALLNGRFFASAGPTIDAIEIGSDGVEVRSSAARAVYLRSGPWDGCAVQADPRLAPYRGVPLARADDGLLTAVRFEPPEFHDWARVEVEDALGRRAWSNPWRVDRPDG